MAKKIFKPHKSFFTKWVRTIKNIDMYGKDIVLTYNGNDKYRTYIGGVASIFVGSIIIIYVIYLFYIMLYKHDTNVATNSAVEDIFTKVKVHQPAKKNFDFAISLVANGIDYIEDTSAFTFTMKQVTQEWNSTDEGASFTRDKTELSLEKWGTTHFNYENQDEVKRIGIDEYHWPMSEDYTVAGSFYAASFHYLELKLKKCTGSASCKTDTEINDIMKESRFNLALVNSVVNFNDYNNPINYAIDDGHFWELTPGFRKKSDVFIRYSVGTFEDDYLQVGFEKTEDFYQVASSKERFEAESTSGDVLTIYLRIDKVTDKYERKIFSFGQLLGQAGGFYGAFLTIGSVFIAIFANRLFTGAVLRRIYQVDTWQEREKVGNQRRKSISK